MNLLVSHLLVAASSALLGAMFGRLTANRIGDKRWDLISGICIFVLVTISLVGILIGLRNYDHATSCQAKYNKDFAIAITARAQANKNTDDSVRALNLASLNALTAVLDPTKSQAEKLTAITDWRVASQNYENSQAIKTDTQNQNPLPVRPECAEP